MRLHENETWQMRLSAKLLQFEMTQHRVHDDGEQHPKLDTDVAALFADLSRNWPNVHR